MSCMNLLQYLISLINPHFLLEYLLILYIIPLYSHHILLLLKFVNFYHQMRFELLRLYLIHVYVQIYFLANIFELYLLYLLN